jgi:hypothetical protein
MLDIGSFVEFVDSIPEPQGLMAAPMPAAFGDRIRALIAWILANIKLQNISAEEAAEIEAEAAKAIAALSSGQWWLAPVYFYECWRLYQAAIASP